MVAPQNPKNLWGCLG